MKYDSDFVGPTENSRRNHEGEHGAKVILPPMEPGVSTDSGKSYMASLTPTKEIT